MLPGNSKWNKVEHRLFSFISINWGGKPLRTFRTIVELIASTTTDAGLEIRAELDQNKYATKVKISKDELAEVNLSRHSFHGDWNYTVSPNSNKKLFVIIDYLIYLQALRELKASTKIPCSFLAWSAAWPSVPAEVSGHQCAEYASKRTRRRDLRRLLQPRPQHICPMSSHSP
jgi:hypothetical protein